MLKPLPATCKVIFTNGRKSWQWINEIVNIFGKSKIGAFYNIYFCYILHFNNNFHKHRWFSGRMLACHAGGPGSIPGRCKYFLSL